MTMTEQAGAPSVESASTRWRNPLETTALIVLIATAAAVFGSIVDALGTPGSTASGWERLRGIGLNALSPWHVAMLAIGVGLVLALRLPFAPGTDERASRARAALVLAAAVAAALALCAAIGMLGVLVGHLKFGHLSPWEKLGEVVELLGGGAAAVAVGLLAWQALTLVPAPPRPVVQPAAAAPGATAARWAADPYGRHQWRYWDGARWSDHVADGSNQSTDPAE